MSKNGEDKKVGLIKIFFDNFIIFGKVLINPGGLGGCNGNNLTELELNLITRGLDPQTPFENFQHFI